MKVLNKYLSVYKLMWKQMTDYRFEFIAELFCTFIPVVSLYYLWRCIYSTETTIKDMNFSEMMLYIVLARLVTMVITPDFFFEIMETIQSGEIQHFICKPINFIFYSFAKYLAGKSEKIIFSTAVYTLIFGVVFKNEIYSGVGKDIAFFFVEVIFAMILYFQIAMAVSLLSFWIYEISSWYYTVTFIIEFLAGGLFPLTLLPEYAQKICQFMPFQYMIFFPIQTLLKGTNMQDVFIYLLICGTWTVAFAMLLGFLWKRGIKHYELIGG